MRTARLACGVAFAAGFLLLLAAVPPAHANSAPVVSNVQAAQIAGTGQVRITYDVSDADGDQVTVWVEISLNGGTFFAPVGTTGDLYKWMAPGPGKQVLWNAGASHPGQYFAQVVAKVHATDARGTGGEMVSVAAGNFTMGSTDFSDAQPVHTVWLSGFSIDKYEVTNAEYKQFIDSGGYSTAGYWSVAGWSARASGGWTQPAWWGNDSYRSGVNWPGFPVIGVSWYEAEAYANFVGKRLPTEAEWEKAARGTDQRAYPWGNSIDGSRANYWGSGDPYESGGAQLTPVGFYDGRLHPSPVFQTTNSPSPYGAYDMAGNVWEWVNDWYQSNYYSVSPSSNPPGPLSGSYRVLRGGAWDGDAPTLRSAYRYGDGRDPTGRSTYIGFRCARTSP